MNRTFGVPRTDQLVPGFGQTLPSYDVWNYSLQDRRGYVLSYSDEERGAFVDRIQARLSLRTYREQREKRRRGSDTFVFEEDEVTTLGVGMDWQKLAGSSHLLTFGVDLENDDVDSRSVTYDLASPSTPPATGEGQYAPSSRFSSAAAFVQDEIFAFEPLYVTAGLRYSVYDFSFREFGGGAKETGRFDALTASLELARELGEGVGLAASLSQGFRAPNLEDLANDGDFANGTELHNADLDPEESLTAELALEVDRAPWRGAFSVFGTRIDDFVGRVLVADPTPGTPGDETYMRENVGELLLWGAEAELARRIGGPGSPYTASASAAWVRGRNYDDSQPELDHVDVQADLRRHELARPRPLEQEEEGDDHDRQRRDRVLEDLERDALELAGGAAEHAGQLRGLLAQGLGQVVLVVEIAELVVVLGPVLGVLDVGRALRAELLDLADHGRDHLEDQEDEHEEGRDEDGQDRQPARRVVAPDADALDDRHRRGEREGEEDRRDEPAQRVSDVAHDLAGERCGRDRDQGDQEDLDDCPGLDLDGGHRAFSAFRSGEVPRVR